MGKELHARQLIVSVLPSGKVALGKYTYSTALVPHWAPTALMPLVITVIGPAGGSTAPEVGAVVMVYVSVATALSVCPALTAIACTVVEAVSVNELL